MKRKRHTAEQIIKKLREAAVLIAGGKTVEEAARQIAVRGGLKAMMSLVPSSILGGGWS